MRRLTAVFDRTEGERAVLIEEETGRSIHISREVLRGLAVEGDIVHLSIERDDAATEGRKSEIKDLLHRLVRGSQDLDR